jgi:hypothetical protein
MTMLIDLICFLKFADVVNLFFFGSVFLFTVEESMVDTITLSYGLHSQISGVFRSLGSQFFSDGYVSLYWLFFLCM